MSAVLSAPAAFVALRIGLAIALATGGAGPAVEEHLAEALAEVSLSPMASEADRAMVFEQVRGALSRAVAASSFGGVQSRLDSLVDLTDRAVAEAAPEAALSPIDSMHRTAATTAFLARAQREEPVAWAILYAKPTAMAILKRTRALA